VANLINEYLNQFIGFSAKQKVLMDAQKYLFEEKRKKIDSIAAEISLVYVTDLKSKEILGIGGSIPSDLINQNWGGFWSVLNRIPTTAPTFSGLINTVNIGQSNGMTVADDPYNTFVANGSTIRVGQGITPPARTDFNVDSGFSNGGPEDSLAGTASGGYNSSLGQVSVAVTITPTGGSGTVNETIITFQNRNVVNVAANYVMARDLISPGVSFILAQSITVVYTWQI